MKMKAKLLLGTAGILTLLLAACGNPTSPTQTAAPTEALSSAAGESAAPSSEAPPVLLGQGSESLESEYAGYQFSGTDPWEGRLTVTVIDIAEGAVDWSFVDSYEGHTLYQLQKAAPLEGDTVEFDIQGQDVEQEGVSFAYRGSLELKDGGLTLRLQSGSVTTQSAEGESSDRIAEALSQEARELRLEKTADGPYMRYTVQSGDSAHSIAEAFGISTKELCILNQIVIMETAKAHGYVFEDVTEYAKYLFPGEELLVPKR